MVLGPEVLSVEQGLMKNFNPNMQLPEKYFDKLCKVAADNNITAEQYAKQIVMSFIARNLSMEPKD